MKVLITGATGLVGQELVKQCHARGMQVHYLTTNANILAQDSHYKGFYWNPEVGEIDSNAFEDVDVIINLAGAPIAKRWTRAHKKSILDSRVQSTELLFKTVSEHQFKISHFINASAIGYYPYSLTNYYEESYQVIDDGFVHEVVREWEKAANTFKSITPVTKIRIGIVLSDKGGALPQLVKPIKAFVGSALGTGKQWQSWIHIDDLIAIFMYVLDKKLEGTFNAVAPNPVTQKILTGTIAKVLKRPLILPRVPEFALRAMLGPMSEIVTKGQRVSSKKIETLGFLFKYHQLQSALEDLLKD